MSDKKQTAVEWLEEQFNSGSFFNWKTVFEQAKQMEKEQIKDAYDEGDIQLVNAEQYYNETYGKETN
jgi:hypothetical protein